MRLPVGVGSDVIADSVPRDVAAGCRVGTLCAKNSAASGLVALVPPPDLLATSPLVRATETAAIVGDAYGEPPTLSRRSRSRCASRP